MKKKILKLKKILKIEKNKTNSNHSTVMFSSEILTMFLTSIQIKVK